MSKKDTKELVCRQASRRDWITRTGTTASVEEVNSGSLQRIADATEAMAKNHNALIAENERLQRSASYWQRRVNSLERSNAALRGHITRLKNRLNNTGAREAGLSLPAKEDRWTR